MSGYYILARTHRECIRSLGADPLPKGYRYKLMINPVSPVDILVEISKRQGMKRIVIITEQGELESLDHTKAILKKAAESLKSHIGG